MIGLSVVEWDDRAGMVDRDASLIKAGLGVNRDVCNGTDQSTLFCQLDNHLDLRTIHPTANIPTNPVCPWTSSMKFISREKVGAGER